jgi:short-subunit dehydrogenase
MTGPRTVLITGASSGIGRALALAYAQEGAILILIGRDSERLNAVAALARAKGAVAITGEVDVRDQLAMRAFITKQDALTPTDLVIANAGITTGLGPDDLCEDPLAVRAILATNLLGVLNTIEPLIVPMSTRGRGQLACVGSLAALRGLPYCPAYSATKAAVHAYTESIRGRLEPRGVKVSLIIAGFVKTPLNDSIDAVKPLELSDTEAAALIRRGLDRGKAVIAFPWPLYMAALLGRALPVRWVDQFMALIGAKVPQTAERV